MFNFSLLVSFDAPHIVQVRPKQEKNQDKINGNILKVVISIYTRGNLGKKF